jgi:hypothetical protein
LDQPEIDIPPRDLFDNHWKQSIFYPAGKPAGCRWTVRGDRIMKMAGTVSLFIPSGDFPLNPPGAMGLMAVFLRER